MIEDAENMALLKLTSVLAEYLGPKTMRLLSDDLAGQDRTEGTTPICFPSEHETPPASFEEAMARIDDPKLRRFARSFAVDLARIWNVDGG